MYKKLGMLSLAILAVSVFGLVSAGSVDMSRLTSSVMSGGRSPKNSDNPNPAQWTIKIGAACSYLTYALGFEFDTTCKNDKLKIFQGHPSSGTTMEYNFILQASEIEDSVINEISFILKNTDDKKMQTVDAFLAKGITTDEIIASCQRKKNIIRCPLSTPMVLKKQEVVYWYLFSKVNISKDHIFEIDVHSVNSDHPNTINKQWKSTNFVLQSYNKTPIQGEPGNYIDSEDTKEQVVKFGGTLQTIYEFTIKAELWEVAVTDMVLDSPWFEGSSQTVENFISCADPKVRKNLFQGSLELYDGWKLIAKWEDYGISYTKFDIKTPLVIGKNSEKKLTIKARTQRSGSDTQCSFWIIPLILGNSGSFTTHISNYITEIKK